ncbi:MAG: hypothetical protein V1668_00025 [Patescibacteria group bacterium]
MGIFLFLAIAFCMVALAYIKVKEEILDSGDNSSLFGRIFRASRRIQPKECTVDNLLKVIADKSRYKDSYVKTLSRQVPYPDLIQLESVRAAVAEHRPDLFGYIQAADIEKPIL